MFIISLLLAYGWINCSNEKKSFEANDIKYRYWQANGNNHLLKIVFYTDSLYNLDKDHFMEQVLQSERNIVEQEKGIGLLVKRKIPEIHPGIDGKEPYFDYFNFGFPTIALKFYHQED